MKKSSILAVLLVSGVAHANPRALPFTYTTDTLPAGQAELEQTVDLVPLRADNAGSGFHTNDSMGLVAAFSAVTLGMTAIMCLAVILAKTH